MLITGVEVPMNRNSIGHLNEVDIGKIPLKRPLPDLSIGFRSDAFSSQGIAICFSDFYTTTCSHLLFPSVMSEAKGAKGDPEVCRRQCD